jgi:antibiotic biosynthesis monooxygenase (ABM) superfamily enzyme
MEHEGKPLAADETDPQHHRDPRVPSVHVRAAATWLAIFPLVAIGMTALGVLVPTWPPVLKALVLTLLVVPTAVYFAVPRLLKGYDRIRSRN